MVPPPPDSVIVNGAVTVVPVIPVRETVAVNVPLPIFGRVAGPVALNPVPENETTAFVTVKLVLMVAACAPAENNRANAKLVRVWIITG
jgi:hypothetical protein